MKVGAKAVVVTGFEGGHNFAKGSIVEFVKFNEHGGYIFKGMEMNTEIDYTPSQPIDQWLNEYDFKLGVDSE